MHLGRYIIIVLSFYFIGLDSNRLFSQSTEIDSLTSVIEGSAHDTLKLAAIVRLTERFSDESGFMLLDKGEILAERLLASGNPREKRFATWAQCQLCFNRAWFPFANDTDYRLARELSIGCVEMARSTRDYDLIGHALNNLGSIEFSLGLNAECMNHIREALHYRTMLGDKEQIAQTSANLGFILFKTGLLSTALDYLYHALDLAEQSENRKLEGTVLHYLGQVYDQQGDYDRMLDIAQRSLVIFGASGEPMKLASGLNNVGRAYDQLGVVDSAMFYFHESLRLREEIGYEHGIANSLNNIGRLLLKMGRAQEAKPFFFRALGIWGNLENSESLPTIHLNLGKLYEALNKPDSTIWYALKAYLLASETQSLAERISACNLLSDAYEIKKKYKEALAFRKEAMELSSQLYNEKNIRELEQQTLNHEFEKKEQALQQEQKVKDDLSESELLRREWQRNLAMAGGAVFLLIAMLLWNRFRLKQRSARQLEQKNAEVESARDRAERSEAFRKEFLANMSHEIRTPMNAIIGMSRLMMDSELSETQRRQAQAINHSGENLLVVLNDVLDLAKLEAGKMTLNPVVFSIEKELNAMIEMHAVSAAEKSLKLSLRLNKGVPVGIRADRGRLAQVLHNLVGNAVKFTAKGWVELRVSMWENKLLFEVEDTGPGMNEKQAAAVFEQFVRGTTDATAGGTGLGLSIAAKLVGLMGGKLEVDTRPGEGSRFYFACRFPEANAPEEITREAIPAVSYPARGKKILVADDNEFNLEVADSTLKKHFPGIETALARSGKEVLEILEDEAFDLVLMDVRMPEKDGYETTAIIRQSSDTTISQMPIIALTASVIRSDLDRCLAVGMNAYIPKPFSIDEFCSTVADSLNLRPTRNTREHDEQWNQKSRELLKSLLPQRTGELKQAVKDMSKDRIVNLVHLMKPQLARVSGRDFLKLCDAILQSDSLKMSDLNALIEELEELEKELTKE